MIDDMSIEGMAEVIKEIMKASLSPPEGEAPLNPPAGGNSEPDSLNSLTDNKPTTHISQTKTLKEQETADTNNSSSIPEIEATFLLSETVAS